MSPALAGGFLATVPPGKSPHRLLNRSVCSSFPRIWQTKDHGDTNKTAAPSPQQTRPLNQGHPCAKVRWGRGAAHTVPTCVLTRRWGQEVCGGFVAGAPATPQSGSCTSVGLSPACRPVAPASIFDDFPLVHIFTCWILSPSRFFWKLLVPYVLECT